MGNGNCDSESRKRSKRHGCESVTIDLARAADKAVRCYKSEKKRSTKRCPDRQRRSRSPEAVLELHINLELGAPDEPVCVKSQRRSPPTRDTASSCHPASAAPYRDAYFSTSRPAFVKSYPASRASPNCAMAEQSSIPCTPASHQSESSRNQLSLCFSPRPFLKRRHNTASPFETTAKDTGGRSCYRELEPETSDDCWNECNEEDLANFCEYVLKDGGGNAYYEDDDGNFQPKLSRLEGYSAPTTGSQPLDARSAIPNRTPRSHGRFASKGAHQRRWEDSSNNSSAEEEVLHNDDKYFEDDSNYAEPPSTVVSWIDPITESFHSSLRSLNPIGALSSGKYLHIDGMHFPATMSPIYNWTLMIGAFAIMLIVPLLIMQNYKPY